MTVFNKITVIFFPASFQVLKQEHTQNIYDYNFLSKLKFSWKYVCYTFLWIWHIFRKSEACSLLPISLCTYCSLCLRIYIPPSSNLLTLQSLNPPNLSLRFQPQTRFPVLSFPYYNAYYILIACWAECFLCAKYCSTHFMWINKFNQQNSPICTIIMGNWGTERLSARQCASI